MSNNGLALRCYVLLLQVVSLRTDSSPSVAAVPSPLCTPVPFSFGLESCLKEKRMRMRMTWIISIKSKHHFPDIMPSLCRLFVLTFIRYKLFLQRRQTMRNNLRKTGNGELPLRAWNSCSSLLRKSICSSRTFWSSSERRAPEIQNWV